MPKITPAQLKKLRTVAGKRFAPCRCRRPAADPSCEYHAWLMDAFGVASTRDLDHVQTQQAIDALEGRKARPPRSRTSDQPWRGRYAAVGTKGTATQAQLDEVARLEHELGWTERRDALQSMIRRQLGRPSSVYTPPHLLANRQASSLVTGMKRLLGHNRQKTSA
jgi:hypothetical protein